MTDTNGWSKAEKYVFKTIENLQDDVTDIRKEQTKRHIDNLNSIASVQSDIEKSKGEILTKIEGIKKDVHHNSKTQGAITGGVVAIIITAIAKFVGLK